MKTTTLLLVASLSLSLRGGCALAPQPETYTPGIVIACGVAAASPGSPQPSPSPDDDSECLSCGGTGWLGDGTVKMDCPDCETPWQSPAPPLTEEHPSPPAGTDAAAPGSNRVPWLFSQQAASELSKASGKPILLHTTAAGCVPCRILERTCFSDPAVIEFIGEHFVPLQVDLGAKREDGKTGAKALQQALGTTKDIPAPAEMLLDSEGSVIAGLTPCSYDSPDKYLAHLQELLK